MEKNPEPKFEHQTYSTKEIQTMKAFLLKNKLVDNEEQADQWLQRHQQKSPTGQKES